LTPEILEVFNVITEPSGLLKGWYVSVDQFAKPPFATVRSLLAAYGGARPYVGIVKVEESADFEYCRGLLHTEISQRWLPFNTIGGLSIHQFYEDFEAGHPGYFLFEGGSLYQIQKFELKMAPEYSARVLEGTRDGRYVEVYLHAVHPSDQPAP